VQEILQVKLVRIAKLKATRNLEARGDRLLRVLTGQVKDGNNHLAMSLNRTFLIRFPPLAQVVFVLMSLVLMATMAAPLALAQQPVEASGGLTAAQISHIITAFTTKELEFRRALNKYAFKRDALLQSLGMGGQITGEYHRVSYFTFDDRGNRFEKISLFPMPSMPSVTQEDVDDLGGINPFALEPAMINRYNFKYVGKEKIDELSLYVFEVTPKAIPDPKSKERLFTGRVWVDDQDLQIAKTRGKGVPETKQNKYPIVETYRELIDGRYWFPTYSYADEELIFDDGSSLHVRMKVRYSDFVLPHTTVTITEADEVRNTPPANPTANPAAGTQSGQQPTPAQSQPIDTSRPVESGVLNKKAIELPEPKLPPGTPKVAGKVIVRVIVDETGKVISAEVEDGRIELRLPALAAARRARFAPLVIEGKPVQVTGLLTYQFYQ
jgi:Gram-negative bacterial TonB protein C-terminal